MAKARSIKVRPWKREDIPALVAVHAAAYGDAYTGDDLYDASIYEMQLAAFPEGQLLVEVDGRIAGYATSVIVQLDEHTEQYDYQQITGAGTFSTHDPAGDTLYGADIAVHPDFRGRGVAGKLYEGRKKLLRRYNLRRMLAFGRIPGYAEVAGKLTAEQYVDQVARGMRSDSALSAHLKAGYTVRDVRIDFLRDPQSLDYSTLLEYANPTYDAAKRRIAAHPIARPFRRARVCAVQYRVRPVKGWDDVRASVEFFVDTANAYHCHVLVFPEMFATEMLSTAPRGLSAAEGIRRLAEYHEAYVAMFEELARDRQLYIIGGSHPVAREGSVYNVAHLFTPSGKVLTQDKLHITASEREEWGIAPGDGVSVFELPFGRIAIQLGYDIEFPELSRLFTYAGVEAIFVPFSTDDRQAYDRVRYAAHARAIENYVYCVLAGTTGNVPTSAGFINYAQSCVLTPSDFEFPPRAVAAEAEPNVETVTIADLDFATLAQGRQVGSIRPLHDRRPDLYDLAPKVRARVLLGD